jgi:hypothetical protein
MLFRTLVPDKPQLRFIIEEDEFVGFYLYIIQNGICVQDYLQDMSWFSGKRSVRVFC